MRYFLVVFFGLSLFGCVAEASADTAETEQALQDSFELQRTLVPGLSGIRGDVGKVGSTKQGLVEDAVVRPPPTPLHDPPKSPVR
jgi:hypothetical protein